MGTDEKGTCCFGLVELLTTSFVGNVLKCVRFLYPWFMICESKQKFDRTWMVSKAHR